MQIIIEYMYSCFGAIILFTLLFRRTIQIETIVRGRGGKGWADVNTFCLLKRDCDCQVDKPT